MLPLEILFLRLALALLVGGIIGAEREYNHKSAGFRTMILISLGACLFTIFSEHIGDPSNKDRIASNIVTGIGFLGAGVIFKADDRAKGLTTAVTIWLTAALGMGIGDGYYAASLIGCILSLMVLVTFTYLEGWMERNNQVRDYKITGNYEPEELKTYEKLFRHFNLKFSRGKQTYTVTELTGIWTVKGSEKNHNKLIAEVLNDKSVKVFEF